MKKKLNWLKNILVCFGALALCGCSALQYSGEDFNKQYQTNVTTNESFYFKPYTKQVNNNVALSIGVTKSQIPDVLAVYIGVQNNSEYPFTFDVDEFSVKTGNKTARYVKPSDYVSFYQDQENALLNASQGIAPTLSSVANIANHYYQGETRQMAIAENNEMEISLKQIATVAAGIESHALRTSAQIPANTKNYYYLFIEDVELYPIEISYSNLKYTFDKQ